MDWHKTLHTQVDADEFHPQTTISHREGAYKGPTARAERITDCSFLPTSVPNGGVFDCRFLLLVRNLS